MLELIIERGMQILQTSQGEKLPRVIETMVRQYAAEPGKCQFTMFVNEPGLCKYDPAKNRITTPGGYELRNVDVQKFKPAESELKPAIVLCSCSVGFHYNTNHRAHYAATIAN